MLPRSTRDSRTLSSLVITCVWNGVSEVELAEDICRNMLINERNILLLLYLQTDVCCDAAVQLGNLPGERLRTKETKMREVVANRVWEKDVQFANDLGRDGLWDLWQVHTHLNTNTLTLSSLRNSKDCPGDESSYPQLRDEGRVCVCDRLDAATTQHRKYFQTQTKPRTVVEENKTH